MKVVTSTCLFFGGPCVPKFASPSSLKNVSHLTELCSLGCQCYPYMLNTECWPPQWSIGMPDPFSIYMKSYCYYFSCSRHLNPGIGKILCPSPKVPPSSAPRTHYEMFQVSLPLLQDTLALHEDLFSFIGKGYLETKLEMLPVLIAIRAWLRLACANGHN